MIFLLTDIPGDAKEKMRFMKIFLGRIAGRDKVCEQQREAGVAGRFVWHELMTADAPAAAPFYAEVVGWTTQAGMNPEMEYTLLLAGDRQAAGLMALTDQAKAGGAAPGWTGYVAVDDVDAGAARAVSLGGTVCMPPMDIPGVGRFAVVADPQGAVIALFGDDGEMPSAPMMTPGTVGWNELMAADMPSAWPFY